MIALLRGVLAEKTGETAIVDVGGVGYLVRVPASTAAALPELTKTVQLRVTTHVRDDAIELFGFATRAEQALFQRLTTVKGVGPRVAMAVLSGARSDELVGAIARGDVSRMKRIPGVGLKIAERICLELKDRILEIAESAASAAPSGASPAEAGSAHEDVVNALMQLGYKESEAVRALQTAAREGILAAEPAPSVQEMLRAALKVLKS